jgi:hypothetical protein
MCEKTNLKEYKKKTPHLCLAENLSKNPSLGNPILKDARLVMCKQSLMTLKLRQKGPKP